MSANASIRRSSFRVSQIISKFDLPPNAADRPTYGVQLPGLKEAWTLGAIVGPSGSGKSSIAHENYGEFAVVSRGWSPDRAVIDQFGDGPTDDLIGLLTSVGLGSAPVWLRPFNVLSDGERFRCELARLLLSGDKIAVCDEFTNSLHRQLAQNISLMLSRRMRRGEMKLRLVVVTSHDDVLPWLEPDWVYRTGSVAPEWGRLRRPELRFSVHRCSRALWSEFARHHYLSGSLSCAAKCYAASHRGRPVAFCAVTSMLGRPEIHRISRLVTASDYQGLGIGRQLLDRVAQSERDEGFRVHLTTSHPAMVRSLERSASWRSLGRRFVKDPPRRIGECLLRTSRGRLTASFEYSPSAHISAAAAA